MFNANRLLILCTFLDNWLLFCVSDVIWIKGSITGQWVFGVQEDMATVLQSLTPGLEGVWRFLFFIRVLSFLKCYDNGLCYLLLILICMPLMIQQSICSWLLSMRIFNTEEVIYISSLLHTVGCVYFHHWSEMDGIFYQITSQHFLKELKMFLF